MKSELFERFNAIHSDLKSTAEKLLIDLGNPASLLERVKQKPRVLVVGEFNAGKSSLINSLLGEVVLPTGITPTTSIVTVLENGPFKITIKQVGLTDPLKVEPGKGGQTGFGMPDFGFDWDGYRKLLTDPQNVEKIEHVHISHPKVPPDIIIVDTPGINDISKSRSEIVYGFIPQVDIVLFLISALKPFSDSERIFLEEKLLSADLKKLVFAVNRIDEIDSDERNELVADIRKSLVESLNKAFEKTNALLGRNLYQKIDSVELFPTCAKEMAPLDGRAGGHAIGFDLKEAGDREGSFASKNRGTWKRILDLAVRDRDSLVEAALHHFLRRAALRVQRGIEDGRAIDTSGKMAVMKRLEENGKRLQTLRETIKLAEKRIAETEASLKKTFEEQIEKTFADLLRVTRIQRDSATVNARIKDLYEYITVKLKSTLDQLYSELDQKFEAVIDDKTFVEQRALSIQYDFSNLPGKFASSMSYAWLGAIFFGATAGMVIGLAYFASTLVANKRSVKEFFMSATVGEDKIKEVKEDLIEKVNREVEYAVDFVRQSLIQRIDVIQVEIRGHAFSLTQTRKHDLNEIQKQLDGLNTRINGFLIERSPTPAAKVP